MNNPDIIAALEPLVKTLLELKIPYYIGGSIASSAYGTARTTLDIDLVIDLKSEKVHDLVNKLKSSYYIDKDMIADAIKRESSFNLIHLATMVKIDLFVLQNQPYYLKSFQRKRKDTFEETDDKSEYYFSSPEDIVLLKLKWYLMGGKVSDHQWSDVLGVLKVQGTDLDMDYLHHWAAVLGCTDLLQQALLEANLQGC